MARRVAALNCKSSGGIALGSDIDEMDRPGTR
jgi:hypothetical protein